MADKLCPPPPTLRLDAPSGGDIVPERPGRGATMQIVHGNHARVPPLLGMRDPAQRARIIHALANHELQAIELFAWALLKFPDAPLAFRRGALAILADEQRHFQLYLGCLQQLGRTFGDYPITGHFWNRLEDYRTPLHFVSAMGLTFENANLDFAAMYREAALAIDETALAEALAVVHHDEISHVHFAWTWLAKLAPGEDPWTTYTAHLDFPLGPHRARGKTFDRQARQRAGLSTEFIDQLEHVLPKAPSGRPL